MKPMLHAAVPLTLLSTQAAMAHPGDHSTLSVMAMMEHVAASPFHTVMWVLAVLGLGLALWRGRAKPSDMRQADRDGDRS